VTIELPSAESVARELARRLRAGEVDAATIEAAAVALDTMASLYERSRGVLANAVDARGRLPRAKKCGGPVPSNRR
jgi:hypothetical protein